MRLKSLFRTRRRRVAAIAASLGLLATTGVAVAAFVFFTGASGTTQGTIETATLNTAITVSEFAAPPPIPVGGSSNGTTRLQNVDTVAHTLTALTGVFSSTPSQCAQYLSYSFGGSNPVGTPLNAGQSLNVPTTYSATAAVPASCSAATWSVAWTGTTSP